MGQQVEEFDRRQLESLLDDTFNGCLSPAGQQDLEQLLGRHAEARVIYWDHVSVHAGLNWGYRGKTECDNRLAQLERLDSESSLQGSQQSEETAAASFRRKSMISLAIAASLLLMAWWGLAPDHPPAGDSRSTASNAVNQTVLGTIKKLSDDSRWSFGKSGDKGRRAFHVGDTLWLRQGAVSLRLVNGVEANLEAPLILQMNSPSSSRVLLGRMTVDVPKGQEGFTVETSAARVIDLGTTFAVDVKDIGTTDVIVFNGEVDVDLSSQEQAKPGSQSGSKNVQRLQKGEALRVAEDGTLSRIVNVRRTDFSGQIHQANVIKEVRDNINRGQTNKYYEIIAGGIREDAAAYVDREYQWNGIDESGIPSYLLGGDYVKTFNDDKVTPNLQMTVVLDRPGIVYLLVDDRLKQTGWLLDQFEDTGDDIGIDEAYRFPNDRRSLDKGPGRSIDQVHSIWRQRSPGVPVVQIGAFGPVSPRNQEKGVKAKLNMYGVVAVPIREIH